MNQHPQLLTQAAEYHEALPPRIRDYLHNRGIPDVLIDFHLLGWNGSRITIPIFDREGAVAFFKLVKDPEDRSDGPKMLATPGARAELAFFKLAKDPEDRSDSPKMLATPGARAELYGWDDVRHEPEDIIICEGEFDRLALKAQGFRAVTSTGGARVFRADLDVRLTYRFVRDTVWVAASWYRPGGQHSPEEIARQYLSMVLDGIAVRT